MLLQTVTARVSHDARCPPIGAPNAVQRKTTGGAHEWPLCVPAVGMIKEFRIAPRLVRHQSVPGGQVLQDEPEHNVALDGEVRGILGDDNPAVWPGDGCD